MQVLRNTFIGMKNLQKSIKYITISPEWRINCVKSAESSVLLRSKKREFRDLLSPLMLLPAGLCGFTEVSCLLLQDAQKRLGTLQDLKEGKMKNT